MPAPLNGDFATIRLTIGPPIDHNDRPACFRAHFALLLTTRVPTMSDKKESAKAVKGGAEVKSGGKKPVWVDEDAHVILKEWATLTRQSMVDVASQLVLETLGGGAAAPAVVVESAVVTPQVVEQPSVEAPVSPAPVLASVPAVSDDDQLIGADEAPVRVVAAPVPPTPAPAPRPEPRRREVPPTGNVQYLGGIWLV